MKKQTKAFVSNSKLISLEEQEHLSLERLLKLNCKYDLVSNYSDRPSANFIDLMNWSVTNFSNYLEDQKVNKFVHNRIIIDGQFLSFCDEKKISVECLYKDSIISWKTDNNFEKFFAQGIFLIKNKDVEFIHCALFCKGTSYEDEINFFVIVPDSNYLNYVKLRNEFDLWVQERDRSNLHVRVIDGEDIAYTRDSKWDDLFLPQDIKFEIKNLVENFLNSKDFYLEKKLPWKRGMLLYGHPGCGKSSIIKTIISEYNFKPVTIIAGANDDAVREAFSYAETQSPSLLFFEDLDSLFEKGVDISTFLNLMDGISTKNGLLVIATANDVRKLKSNITQRPSRFDRKYEIPVPNQEMSLLYLKKWFGNIITPAKYKDLANFATKYEFTYAYLKELYISSMFEALSHNRSTPSLKDIDNTLNRLLKDKNMLNGNAIHTDKYFK